MAKIAFLGLGAMGSRMGANLIKAGHHLAVWNRDKAKAEPLAAQGADMVGTPKAAAARADVVIAMVRDDEASRAVWLDADTGALAGMSRHAVAIDCSTLTVGSVQALASEAAARGIAFLDAPVAGSRSQAEAGQLIFMAGGDSNVLARVEPVLKAMGSVVHHAGPNGAGAAVKLAVNSLLSIQVAALAETIGLLRASGVCPITAMKIVTTTPVASPAATVASQSMLTGTFAPMFPVELAEKDLRYIEETARARHAAAPLAAAARAVMQRAIERGYGADNLTGVVRLYTTGS